MVVHRLVAQKLKISKELHFVHLHLQTRDYPTDVYITACYTSTREDNVHQISSFNDDNLEEKMLRFSASLVEFIFLQNM